jgi:hypothetical protein
VSYTAKVLGALSSPPPDRDHSNQTRRTIQITGGTLNAEQLKMRKPREGSTGLPCFWSFLG